MARTKHALRRNPAKKVARAQRPQTKKQQKEEARDTLEEAKLNANVGDFYTTTRKDVPRQVVLLDCREGCTKWRMVPEGKSVAQMLTSRTIPRPNEDQIAAYADRRVVTSLGYDLLNRDVKPLVSFSLSHRSDGNSRHYYWKKILTPEEESNRTKKSTSEVQKARSQALRKIAQTLNNAKSYVPIQKQQRIATSIASSLDIAEGENTWEKVLEAIEKDDKLIARHTEEKDRVPRGASNRTNTRKAGVPIVYDFVITPPQIELVPHGEGRRQVATEPAKKAPAKKAAAKSPKKASAKASSSAAPSAPAKKAASPAKKAAASTSPKKSSAKASSSAKPEVSEKIKKDLKKIKEDVDKAIEDAKEEEKAALKEEVEEALSSATKTVPKSSATKTPKKSASPPKSATQSSAPGSGTSKEELQARIKKALASVKK